MMRTLGILGATGSIGTQALDMVKRYSDRFSATVLTAHSSADALFELVRIYRPEAAGLIVKPDVIPEDVRFCEWFFGEDCSEQALLYARPDDALAAVVGIAGLNAVMTALTVCERVLLANKEALVTGGELVMKKAAELKRQLLPVDSEHSAIFQCLQGAGTNRAERLILTASGGPFRTWNKEAIQNASIEEALGHPTWNMGGKITVDCATMMNKGLEVIEAHYLFHMPAEKIDVVVHPDSIIHSMVEYADGSVMAQMGLPDMRAAIGYAMGYPERLPFGAKRLELWRMGTLRFEEPDVKKFPCLRYAYEALREGGAMPIVLNGSNEAAVYAFLRGKIRFGDIERVVAAALDKIENRVVASVQDVHEIDHMARSVAEQLIRVM